MPCDSFLPDLTLLVSTGREDQSHVALTPLPRCHAHREPGSAAPQPHVIAKFTIIGEIGLLPKECTLCTTFITLVASGKGHSSAYHDVIPRASTASSAAREGGSPAKLRDKVMRLN